MQVLIKKWGNSASVRIPATVMAAAALSVDQAVEVREENGRIIIEPVRAPTYVLDELLEGMKPDDVAGRLQRPTRHDGLLPDEQPDQGLSL